MTESLFVYSLPPDLSVQDALSRFASEPCCVLFDSAARVRSRDARWSFLTADPLAVERIDAVGYGDRPFESLRQWQHALPGEIPDDAPPFCGGIAGLLSYELGQAFERLPRPEIDEFRTPAMLAGLYDWCLAWDHIAGTVVCCVLRLATDAIPGQAGTSVSATDRLAWVRERLSCARPPSAGILRPAGNCVPDERVRQEASLGPDVWSAFSPPRYLQAVGQVIEYIRAGDIFQANLSQRLLAEWRQSPAELYRNVRSCNPAPFCGYLGAPDFAVVSASPERFLRVHAGGRVETRPIKGTRRRQRSPIADLFTSDELAASDKDRAENVMIVDLLRNDLSRVCLPGTVRVTGLCEVEVFETVQHLVSTVEGQLSEDRDVWDLLTAAFPGGSVTGAPKIRAMEIIAELEPTVRGAYCGSLFYCGPRGEFDSSILIRTFTWKAGWVQFPVGGGIVADSEPASEYRETLDKAAGLLSCLP